MSQSCQLDLIARDLVRLLDAAGPDASPELRDAWHEAATHLVVARVLAAAADLVGRP